MWAMKGEESCVIWCEGGIRGCASCTVLGGLGHHRTTSGDRRIFLITRRETFGGWSEVVGNLKIRTGPFAKNAPSLHCNSKDSSWLCYCDLFWSFWCCLLYLLMFTQIRQTTIIFDIKIVVYCVRCGESVQVENVTRFVFWRNRELNKNAYEIEYLWKMSIMFRASESSSSCRET